jgi:hypothetical protein
VGENTMRATLWTFEVEHVKSTTRLEDALDRPQRPVLFVGRQVVEHTRREHTVTDESGGSGVKSITYNATGAQPIASTAVNGTSTNVLIGTEGITTISFHATDLAGNVESPDHTVTVKLDKTAPAFNCASGDAAWHAMDVSIACTASPFFSTATASWKHTGR